MLLRQWMAFKPKKSITARPLDHFKSLWNELMGPQLTVITMLRGLVQLYLSEIWYDECSSRCWVRSNDVTWYKRWSLSSPQIRVSAEVDANQRSTLSDARSQVERRLRSVTVVTPRCEAGITGRRFSFGELCDDGVQAARRDDWGRHAKKWSSSRTRHVDKRGWWHYSSLSSGSWTLDLIGFHHLVGGGTDPGYSS